MENNVKGLKKQLVAAIAMVLVAGIALGSSTFAWFVNSDKATAQGMSINAVADSSLMIKGVTDTDFSALGTTNISVMTLKPASSKDGVNIGTITDDVKVNSSDLAGATWNGGNGDTVAEGDVRLATEAKPANGDEPAVSGEYITALYEMKAVGSKAKVYANAINITTNETQKTIKNAVRVAISIVDASSTDVENDTVTYIYNPANGTNLGNKVLGFNGTAWELADDSYDTLGATTTDVWNFEADTVYKVTVKVWFEGQDQSCFTTNTTTNGIDITIDFKKIDVTN